MKDLGANIGKFQNRFVTRDGQTRASVTLRRPQTLWFNTGSLCNIACTNCYIESSPSNDALVYLGTEDVDGYLDQIVERNWPVGVIGFTGGEPFMNPQMITMAGSALERGYRTLILTNAMRPMMRPSVQAGLRALQGRFGARMTLRVSLDHHRPGQHDGERGVGSFERTLAGMCWLRDQGIAMTVAARTLWDETESDTREGFARLFRDNGLAIDAQDREALVLFPEMDLSIEVPEISTACWERLGKSPESVMCASSRMVVRRKGAAAPSVVACTLLPYEPEFELGHTLAEAEAPVYLNHPHCAKFCVLGGAKCSG